MSKSSQWDGSYNSTKEASQSLWDDMNDAVNGKICEPTGDGGTLRIQNGRVDIYEPNSGSGSKEHSHFWFNSNTGECGGRK